MRFERLGPQSALPLYVSLKDSEHNYALDSVLIPCPVSVDRDDVVCKGVQRITAHTIKHTKQGKQEH